MYKFLSIFLAILLLAAGGVYGFERWQHSNTRRNLNNQLAEVQETQQETESARSRLALESENLQATNGDLQEIIDDREEAILALTQANIKLKNRVIRIENAQQTVVDPGGNPVLPESVPDECKNRIRVDFEKEQDPLRVSGHTLTNPPYAEITLEWLRDLRLELVLTQDPDKTYRVYIDSENSDIVPTDLILQIDPSVLDYRWYQKIGFNSAFVVGETGVALNLSAVYDVMPNLSVGPMFQIAYVNGKAETYYGVLVSYYPWK